MLTKLIFPLINKNIEKTQLDQKELETKHQKEQNTQKIISHLKRQDGIGAL
jgi:hypothetical protein